MSIEQTFERIADALEAIVALATKQAPAAAPKAAKPKPATESAAPAPALAPAAASAPAAVAAPAAPEPPTFPPIAKVNDAISKLAGKDRAQAVAILRKHGVEKTPQLKQESYQAVIDDADEAAAKIDAASVNASLV